MSQKILERIRKIKAIEKNYIVQVKKAVETVPSVEKNIEWTEWAEQSVVQSEKKGVDVFNTPEFNNSLSLIEDSIKSALPDLSIDPQLIGGTVGAANASLSAVVFDRINSGTTDLTLLNLLNTDYYNLQKKQNIVADIADRLPGLNLKDEFLKAVDKYIKTTSGISSHEEAAIIMRNVIEGLQGSLFESARKKMNILQKKITWELISSNLAIGGIGSSQSSLLLSKKFVYKDIHKELTDIAKNSGSNPMLSLQTCYSKWLDFLYTTLNLIDPKYLK